MPSSILDGELTSGQEVRDQHVIAAVSIANILKTSLGPIGLDKMLVDDIGEVTISNDGATILALLDVEHPAAKMLVELAHLQDQEVGDGTTSVVLVAAELLKRANELVKQKIHPTSIISGYRLAATEAAKYIKQNLALKVDNLDRTSLMNIAKTSLSSKILGKNSDFFADLAVNAILRVRVVDEQNKTSAKYPLNSINILKAPGQDSKASTYVEGFALNCTIAAQGMPKFIKGAKIACLDFNLQKAKMKQGVQVLIKDPSKLEAVRDRELDIVKERIDLILKAGANVVLTTKGIDDLCLKYFVEAGAMAVRRVSGSDMTRIAEATGAQVLLTLANLEGEESFEASSLGTCETVSQEPVGDNELILFRGCKTSRTASIILRGPSTYMLEEMERSLHDSLCAIKRALESGNVVPGGGAVESALSIYLENFATTLGSREQLAIAQFAEALLVIPKQLSVNAALDSTDLVAKLRAYHNAAQTDSTKKNYAHYGLDLKNGKLIDNIEAGVLEPMISKVKSIQFATEAAITILRIDSTIKLNPKAEPQRPH